MDMSIIKTLESSDELIDIENHFKLYAGPGAGKTSFLVNHINNIISNSKRLGLSKKVACITYTNTGVNTVRDRLGTSVDHVEVSTIHSFLYKHVLKPYIWLLKDTYKVPINKLDGHDIIIPRYSIMSEWKTNTNQYYIKDTDKLSEELLSLRWSIKADLTCNLSFKYASSLKIKNDSLIEYKKLCWENSLISHDDVLFLSYEILRINHRVQDIIRAKFPYILVDEFQDTSPIQAEILKLIGNKETIIGVIGDVAQAIYTFQGADPKKFIDFKLENLNQYKIENNHRSTEEIVSVLNHLRNDKDFQQESLKDDKNGSKPRIIVGDAFESLEKTIQILGTSNIYTLAYRNENSSRMKNLTDKDIESVKFNDLLYTDSNKKRGWVIAFLILAIENAVVSNYKDAIKYMKKAYRKSDDFSSKDALLNLKRLIDCYDEYKDLSIKDFYNTYVVGYHDVGSKISAGNPNKYYGNLNYQSAAVGFELFEEDSRYMTIHKSKGEEYDNVFVVIPEKDEEKSLEFIFNQNIANKQDHRVYYVACSRAKENLFINVSKLTTENKKRLETIGFSIID